MTPIKLPGKRHGCIVTFGEILVDMISVNTGNLTESRGFLKRFGGAPANTAVGLAGLGVPVKFIGKVGRDAFGEFLKQTLVKNSVEAHLLTDKAHKTTLAFVSLDLQGGRSFDFYPGSHDRISPQEVDLPIDCSILHFGSLTQIRKKCSEATDKLMRQALDKHALISYDPNIREALWGNLNVAKEIVLKTAQKVHILKINEEEAQVLTGESDMVHASEKLFTPNLQILLITLGPSGSLYRVRGHYNTVPTIKVSAIDTTGAGDAFNAGFLYGIWESGLPPDQLEKLDLESIIKRANRIASLTTTKKGAISAIPTKKDLEKSGSFSDPAG